MVLASLSPSDALRNFRAHDEEDVMGIEAILGILLMLVATALMGWDLQVHYGKSGTITGAKCVSVFWYFLGALLLAPAAVALFPTIFNRTMTILIYGTVMVFIGLVATVFMSWLWNQFLMRHERCAKRHGGILISS